jgi:hypothetical protein
MMDNVTNLEFDVEEYMSPSSIDKLIVLSTGGNGKNFVGKILADNQVRFYLWVNPKFNEGLVWQKFDGKGNLLYSINEVDYDLNKMASMFEDGFVPTSDWFTAQTLILGEERAKMELG